MIYYLYVLLLIWFAKTKILAALGMCLRTINVYFCYCFIFTIFAEIWHQGYTDLKSLEIFEYACTFISFCAWICLQTHVCMHACTWSSTCLSCFMCMNINTGCDSMQLCECFSEVIIEVTVTFTGWHEYAHTLSCVHVFIFGECIGMCMCIYMCVLILVIVCMKPTCLSYVWTFMWLYTLRFSCTT